MNADPTLAWLLGEGPDPGAAARDSFTDIAPPTDVVAATQEVLHRARSEDSKVVPLIPRRSWWAASSGLAAMAALALFSLRPAPEIGDPSRMVARGLEVTASPEVHLKMAVQAEGELHRHSRGQTYASGDQFFFRYQMASDGWVHLVRSSGAGVEVLHSVAVSAGEDDLRHRGELLAWTASPQDGQASFALLATAGPTPEIARILGDELAPMAGPDAQRLCSAARQFGWTCDGVDVQVAR